MIPDGVHACTDCSRHAAPRLERSASRADACIGIPSSPTPVALGNSRRLYPRPPRPDHSPHTRAVDTAWICGVGHIVASGQLRSRGATQRDLSAAVRSGRLIRLKPGTYACSHADSDLRAAAKASAQLDCLSVLGRIENQWTGVGRPALHLRAKPGTHLGAVPADYVVHWSRRCDTAPVSTVEALVQSVRCLSSIDWLASVESALHLGAIDFAALDVLETATPQRMLPTLSRLNRGAQSGFETHTRVLLQNAGHTVATQVPVPGTGPLDLLVDGCVGVETDGEKWHAERFLEDRTKDIVVEGWGIRVLRIGRPHIFTTWPQTLATIERMIRDARRGSRAHG